MGRKRLINEGDIFTNISGLKYEVVTYLGNKRYIVKFISTGNEVEANNGNVKAGKVKDNQAPTVSNIGQRGVPREYIRKEYDAWKNMLYRVNYDSAYTDVSVCDRWLVFENFLEDIPKLKNYGQWLTSLGATWALDKDIKYKGNKVYCPSACMFVTTSDNSKAVPFKIVNRYEATNKDLRVKLIFCNQRKFSNDYGLNYKNVSRAIKTGGTTKGWSFKTCKD